MMSEHIFERKYKAMGKATEYDYAKYILRLLWKHDDMMTQETLFEAQDYALKLAMKLACKEDQAEDLIANFPFLFKSGALEQVGGVANNEHSGKST
jgi:hypothetical protein